jgi:hypothetical protein
MEKEEEKKRKVEPCRKTTCTTTTHSKYSLPGRIRHFRRRRMGASLGAARVAAPELDGRAQQTAADAEEAPPVLLLRGAACLYQTILMLCDDVNY